METNETGLISVPASRTCRKAFIKKKTRLRKRYGTRFDFYDVQVKNQKTLGITHYTDLSEIRIRFEGNYPNHPNHGSYVAWINPNFAPHNKILKKILTPKELEDLIRYFNRPEINNPPNIPLSKFDNLWFHKKNEMENPYNLRPLLHVNSDNKPICRE